jgi:hypothetical protein
MTRPPADARLVAGILALCASAALADPPTPPGDPMANDTGPAVASSELYVYAARGQSDKQLDRDRYECHNWAVRQSNYNPSDPRLAPHQQVQVVAAPAPAPGAGTIAGAVAGAVIGAAIGHPHDAAEGAVVGAIAGGAMGAASESARRQQAARASGRINAEAQAERAQLERQASDYRRAISACLEGRGYTVK